MAKAQKNLPTVKLKLDTRREKANGTFPVKLAVTYRRKQKQFRTPYNLTFEDFDRIAAGKRLPENLRKLKSELDAMQANAIKATKEIKVFSFETFEAAYFSDSQSGDLFKLFEGVIREQQKKGSAANAEMYVSTLKSLKKFTCKESLSIEEVTPAFLQEWDSYMSVKGNHGKGQKLNGRMMYLRTLRSVINYAIEAGVMQPEQYPFKKGKGKLGFAVQTSENVKRPLSMEQIQQLAETPPANEYRQKALDFFLFSFACSGMNVADIVRLKWENITGETLYFHRKKTANKAGKAIEITLDVFTESIIEKYGTGSTYVFDVLTESMIESEKVRATKAFTRLINQHLKLHAKQAGIAEWQKISTYYARHSWASIAIRNETSLALISQQLGHANIKTTQNYLSNFSKEEIKAAQTKITGFLSEKRTG